MLKIMQKRLKIIVLTLGAVVLIGLFAQFRVLYQSSKVETEIHIAESECTCYLDGVPHDFCYRLPADSHLYGRRFNCTYAAYLEKLDLLSDSNALNMATSDMPKPMFVTAMSDNHYKEGLTLIANIRKLWSQQKIIVYNLGLNDGSVAELKEKCLVELRDFPFHNYPNHVRDLMEFRWKPLLIAMTVKEFGAIWYMDTSVRWKKDRLDLVYKEINCRKDRGWTWNNIDSVVTDCRKPGYLLHSSSGHSVYATTNPGVYDFIPTLPERLRSKSCLNYDAGFAFVVRTSDSINILKWYVLCALEKNCMAPYGASPYCAFEEDRFYHYANCHRYDQSIINLLLANSYDYNSMNYVTDLGIEGAAVDRTAAKSFKPDDFSCVKTYMSTVMTSM
ncbi:hypothetical protein KIN20_024134 [Parelaphostrongylus tenuis]|uniref:Uncharacterized protein n=1 Tax=Parelaphostrongylus tenuis TaxID=148309 RepID=A0AAD5N7W0_PARTN|nr:hypothetical protein KIN20_024134 [Parelaphostrongylus tenuis]